MGSIGVPWDTFEPLGTLTDPLGHLWTPGSQKWDTCEPPKTGSQNYTKNEDYMETPGGIAKILSDSKSVTKKKHKIRDFFLASKSF